MYTLVIGNKNYSSWSLRAWLYLKESRIDFKEIRLAMFADQWKEKVASYSPAKRVPVLIDGELAIWDSLAIIEYLQEKEGTFAWPEDLAARALARSITAEMHSGFMAIRNELPQNIRARNPRELADFSEAARHQIERVVDIWTDARQRFGQDGPWLFGQFSIADAFYAPVALRFATYQLDLGPVVQDYVQAVQNLDSIKEWSAAAAEETESFPFIDNLSPIEKTPLTPG